MLRGHKLPRARRLDERGATAVMTALLAIPLIGVSALAVDVGIWQMNKSAMQGAADQALLAAGLAKAAGGNAESARKEALGVAAAHGFANAPPKTTVTVDIPTTGSYAGNANALQVLITQQQQTFLSGVIKDFVAPVASASAVGVAGGAKMCILALAGTGTGLSTTNSSKVDVGDCNIYINSTSNCALNLINNSQVTAKDIFIGGSAGCKSSLAKIFGNQIFPKTQDDPYKDRLIPAPASSCTSKILDNNKSEEIGPGTYCSISVTDSSRLALRSGLYIIDGGEVFIDSNSHVTGAGVTIVLTSRTGTSYKGARVSRSSTLQITAMTSEMTSASHRGFGLWVDKRGSGNIVVDSTAGLIVTGVIYAPNASVTWSNSSSSFATSCTQLIVNTVSLASSAKFTADCAGVGFASVGGSSGYTLKE